MEKRRQEQSAPVAAFDSTFKSNKYFAKFNKYMKEKMQIIQGDDNNSKILTYTQLE